MNNLYMSKRLLSFDVGIKNLAYCIVDISENEVGLQIVEWNVLNLCNECLPTNTNQICGEILKNKKLCAKQAKYCKLAESKCDRHAKISQKYTIPLKEHSTTSLKKLKLEELKDVFTKANLTSGTKKKEILLTELIQFYNEKEWDTVIIPKKKNASKTDLITLGRSLHRQLSENPIMSTVTHVIIENQISPIANRMKTIQGMIAQHYISLGIKSIEFVSSGNKLKNMVKQSSATTGYKQNKQDGIFYCEKYLNDNDKIDTKWHNILSKSTKKDDLCDCFLQALWWKDSIR